MQMCQVQLAEDGSAFVFSAKEGVIQLALRKTVVNFCLITAVPDVMTQLWIGLQQWTSLGFLRKTD